MLRFQKLCLVSTFWRHITLVYSTPIACWGRSDMQGRLMMWEASLPKEAVHLCGLRQSGS